MIGSSGQRGRWMLIAVMVDVVENQKLEEESSQGFLFVHIYYELIRMQNHILADPALLDETLWKS